MTWKPKKTPIQAGSIERIWEKYGTWVLGAVTVVLVVVLAVMFVHRYREGKLRTGETELEGIGRELPTAVTQLRRLEFEYGDTALGPRVQLRLAQVLFWRGEYDEALYRKLLEDKTLKPLEKAQVNLGLAYLAQERNNLAEARERFEQVRKEELYASEAARMIDVIDKMETKPSPKGKEDKDGMAPKP